MIAAVLANSVDQVVWVTMQATSQIQSGLVSANIALFEQSTMSERGSGSSYLCSFQLIRNLTNIPNDI